MNSTTRTLAIAAVLTAATLVVGGTFAAAQSASAYGDKRDDGKNNGNTITVQINKQKGSQSGFDNSFEQEAQNVICTHPSAPCTQEGTPVAGKTTSGGEDNNGEDNGGD